MNVLFKCIICIYFYLFKEVETFNSLCVSKLVKIGSNLENKSTKKILMYLLNNLFIYFFVGSDR